MMLLTPTMPASRVPSPTIQVSSLMPRVTPRNFSMNSATAIIQAAFSSSGAMMCRAKTVFLQTSCKVRLSTSSRPATASMWTVLPKPKSCCTRVAGSTTVRSTLLNETIELCRCWTPTTVK